MTGADEQLVEAVAELRSGPLTGAMLFASGWFVKAPLFLIAAALHDLLRRARVPATLLLVGLAAALSSGTANLLKLVFDRERPGGATLVDLPSTASLPSGHAATAFGAAVALGLLVPRLRVPALAVAALVALSRVYLGVHYPTDVVAGALVGTAIALVVVYASSGFSGRSSARDSAPARPGRGSGRGVPD